MNKISLNIESLNEARQKLIGIGKYSDKDVKRVYDDMLKNHLQVQSNDVGFLRYMMETILRSY
jgi:uncharacterized membrane-anchored protein